MVLANDELKSPSFCLEELDDFRHAVRPNLENVSSHHTISNTYNRKLISWAAAATTQTQIIIITNSYSNFDKVDEALALAKLARKVHYVEANNAYWAPYSQG